MSMIVVSRLDPLADAAGASSSTHSSRKRKRALAHQDPPPRLRKWVVGLRKTERDRVRGISGTAPSPIVPDEIRLEKGIALRKEGRSECLLISGLVDLPWGLYTGLVGLLV